MPKMPGEKLRQVKSRRRMMTEKGQAGPYIPPYMMSHTIDSAFINPSLGVWEDAPLCQKVRPRTSQVHLSPLRLGVNYTKEAILAGHRRQVQMRAMIWTARSGMGNSIQGFICSFLFAILSGRQFLVSTGGVYGSTFDTVALGFDFNLDRMEKTVPHVPMIDFRKLTPITGGAPVVQGNPREYYDDSWYAIPQRRWCIMQALNCATLWCVRSRVVNIMFGRPRETLGYAIRKVLRVLPPASVEMHSRRRRRLLGTESAEVRALGVAPIDSGTDPKKMAREASEVLGLKFDIAVHVRAAHKCTEGYSDLPGCQEKGMEGALQALEIFPAMRPLLALQRWGCISQLLAFLLKLKLTRRRENKGSYPGFFSNPRDKNLLVDFVHVRHKRQAVRPKDFVNSSATPIEKFGLWRVEDALGVAEGVRVAEKSQDAFADEAGLNILLATDAEALRPILVEYLRPFGTVAYSASRVMHLAHSGGDEMMRLGNLAEFYLMSRSSVILSYRTQRSSYARSAALYGNSTLIYGSDRLECKFPVEHYPVFEH